MKKEIGVNVFIDSFTASSFMGLLFFMPSLREKAQSAR
jgi:hypothetical protein